MDRRDPGERDANTIPTRVDRGRVGARRERRRLPALLKAMPARGA
jgi:hypothetical protein